MSFTYKDGARVVNMIAGDDMTAGKVYTVINSYDGHAGAGHEQEYVRVANDRGWVVGYDPDRFIPYEAADRAQAMKTAMRMHRRLASVLAGVPRDGVLKELRSKLDDLMEDLESVIANTAAAPEPGQIIFNNPAPAFGNETCYEVRIDKKVVALFTTRIGPSYDITFPCEARTPIRANTFNSALNVAKEAVRARAARDVTLAAWAARQPVMTLADLPALAS